MILDKTSYWLKNAHVPLCILESPNTYKQTLEGLCQVDMEIDDGRIVQIIPSTTEVGEDKAIDIKKKIILPGFIDMHTHLDKGHLWPRCPNLDGTFDNALSVAKANAEKYWVQEDVYRRMEFGLKCSYAHGTTAIRTHIDSFGQQADISLTAFSQLQREWAQKITLQAVSLVSLDYYETEAGIALADKMAAVGGILGGVAFKHPDLEVQLETVFRLACERGLDLDFHADENDDPDSDCLRAIARTALKTRFQGKIICGHCCSLAVQSPAVVEETLSLVKEAGIGIVSLPMCNLYLQDRHPDQTPYWRGVTKVKEIKDKGIPVAFASDNCRDPFYGFGDHDGLEVLRESVRIAHLDANYGDWCASVSKVPADLLGLGQMGRLESGLTANFIVFNARYFSELFSRPQSDRMVVRKGKSIDSKLPDYAELDDLFLN
ncbi:MAG: Pterin deaminase [Chroococcopsis gigantea SAG 12.99]|jgi:cytosine deaminase|nr:Pterin deaminase [Chroococcopsis gigantea SAG 12.99]